MVAVDDADDQALDTAIRDEQVGAGSEQRVWNFALDVFPYFLVMLTAYDGSVGVGQEGAFLWHIHRNEA